MAATIKDDKKRTVEVLRARQDAIAAIPAAEVTAAQLDEFDALQAAIENLSTSKRVSAPYASMPLGADVHFLGDAPKNEGKLSKHCAASLFKGVKASDEGFSDLADVGRAILLGDSLRLMAISGQSVGIPSDGGFAVPTSFAFDMLDKSVETEVVRPRARVVGMPSAEHHIAGFDDRTHANGSLFGGLEGQWIVEGGEINYEVAKLRKLILKAQKLGFLTSATNELLTDAPGFEGQFSARMTQALGFNLDRACLVTGTGAGQPLSVLKADSTITVTKETGQAADTIVYENLTKMFARLHPGCLGNSVWVINQTAIPQLLKLSIPIGTGGSHIPVMTGSSGNFEILTRPVVFTEKLNPLGDLGDIMLVDFSQYIVGLMAGGMRLDRSQHVKFTTDETVWRLIVRATGVPLWASAFTPANGDTLSWAVTLAARA